MNDEDPWDDEFDEGDADADEEFIACPECGAEIDADSEACPRCGYWITEADRDAAWRAGSATGRVRRIGWWIIAVALVGSLLAVSL